MATPSASLPPAGPPLAPACTRPTWSGLLRFHLVCVPLRAYPAVAPATATPLHLLHADCGQRIRLDKRCPIHGSLAADAIVRGFAAAPGHHVIVEPEELQRLRPARDRELLLEHCLPAHQVDPSLYAGHSLYLLPDGPAACHPYAVLAEAFRQTQRWAVGRVVLSTHRRLVLVRPTSRWLLLDLLHYPAQVRAAPQSAAAMPGDPAAAAELPLARQLLDAASGPLDWTQFRDRSAEEWAALVQAKLTQQPVEAAASPAAGGPLLEALRQSVAATQAAPHDRPAQDGARQLRCSRPGRSR